jgi:hypothetical protein
MKKPVYSVEGMMIIVPANKQKKKKNPLCYGTTGGFLM